MKASVVPDLALSRGVLIAVVISSVFTVLGTLDWGEAIDDYVTRRAEFTVRSLLHRAPAMSPKIKIFIYDDQTVAKLQAGDISLADWSSVFEALAAAGPRHIIVDKLFDLPKDIAGAAAFNARMALIASKYKVPIVTGGFVTPTAILERPLMPLDQQWNMLEYYGFGPDHLLRAPDLLAPPAAKLFAYGPHPKLAGALNHVGGIVYSGGGRAMAVTRIDMDSVLPHISLFVADNVSLTGGELRINGQRVMTRAGQVQANFSERNEYAQRSFGMTTLIEYARSGKTIPVVQPGDEVLILPGMFTGSADWYQTPAGLLPGGYLVAALVNSVLTDAWLQPVQAGGLLTWIGGALGLACGLLLWGRLFWLASCVSTAAICGIGLLSFTYQGLMWPWLYPAICFFATALTIFVERSRVARIRQVLTDHELETAGLVQRSLFPKSSAGGVEKGETTANKRMELVGHFQAADQCSGDWWWHANPEEGIEYVIVGDAMGHGVPAALVMGLMYASVRTLLEVWERLPAEERAPAQILARLNKILFSSLAGELTMTMFVARFDLREKSVTFANAAHCFPLSFGVPGANADKRPIKALAASGTMLGLTDQVVFQERTMAISSGERFVFYTDGVVENPGIDGRPWGKKAFLSTAGGYATRSVRGMLTELVQIIVAQQHRPRPLDDYTIVIAEVP